MMARTTTPNVLHTTLHTCVANISLCVEFPHACPYSPPPPSLSLVDSCIYCFEEMPTAGNKSGGWLHFHARLNHAADDFWYRVGKWVATHAKTTVAVSLFFVIICCFGFANFRIETEGKNAVLVGTLTRNTTLPRRLEARSTIQRFRGILPGCGVFFVPL